MGWKGTTSWVIVRGGSCASASMTLGLSNVSTCDSEGTHACLTIISLMRYRRRLTAPNLGPSRPRKRLVTLCWNVASERNGSAPRNPPIMTPILVASSRSHFDQDRGFARGRLLDLGAFSTSPPCCKCLVGAIG